MGEDTKPLTERDLERIAEAAADRALEKVYGDIGRSVITRVFWIAGALALGFAAAKGWVSKP